MGIRWQTFFTVLAVACAAHPRPCLALIGEYLDVPSSLAQACRIGKKTANGFESFCSSTQISGNELLTSAHCFNDYDGYKNLFADCPGEAPRAIEVYFKQSNIDRLGQGAAVIRVTPAFSAPPVCLAGSRQQVEQLVARSNQSNPKTCFYASYGNDNQGKQGVFHAARAVSLSLSKDGQILDSGGPAQHGDSGGSFYCMGADGQWFLVGITQGALISSNGVVEKSTSHVDNIETVRDWVNHNTTGDRGNCAPRPAAPEAAPVTTDASGTCPPVAAAPGVESLQHLSWDLLRSLTVW